MNPGRKPIIDARYPTRDDLVEAVREWGVSGVADIAGVSPSAVSKRLRRYGLRAAQLTEVIERESPMSAVA